MGFGRHDVGWCLSLRLLALIFLVSFVVWVYWFDCFWICCLVFWWLLSGCCLFYGACCFRLF